MDKRYLRYDSVLENGEENFPAINVAVLKHHTSSK
jgi:hypothetical protein